MTEFDNVTYCEGQGQKFESGRRGLPKIKPKQEWGFWASSLQAEAYRFRFGNIVQRDTINSLWELQIAYGNFRICLWDFINSLWDFTNRL